ncbi:hypothetical protein HDR61_05155 [bacterium]|nr:hypothetical protein [bacterium]
MAIMVSADYFGGVISHLRQKDAVSALRLAHLFGCGDKIKQLHRYESGKELIPRDVLARIIKYAAKMDAALGQD